MMQAMAMVRWVGGVFGGMMLLMGCAEVLPNEEPDEEQPGVCEAAMGRVCEDGTLYAGHFSEHDYYVLEEHQGASVWSSTLLSDLGANNTVDGQANSSLLLSLEHTQGYEALRLCATLEAHGHQDWFLPSEQELLFLYDHQDEIGLNAQGFYWSSTETTHFDAVAVSFDSGYHTGSGKNRDRQVRCVRKAQPAGKLD